MDVQLYSFVIPTLIAIWGITRTQAGELGTAALLVPFGNVLYDMTGKNWTAVFVASAILNILASLTALVVLKPLRKRTMAQSPPADLRLPAG